MSVHAENLISRETFSGVIFMIDLVIIARGIH